MRLALVAAVALTAAVGMTSASAGTPVLDGKKVKNLHVVQEAPTGAALVGDPTAAQVAGCKVPACARLSFIYKPAKGVKAPLSVLENNFWAGVSDDDLYLMQGSKVVASCTGTFSNKRYLSVPAKSLKSGTTYTAVLFYSHEIGETTSFDVDLPGVASPPAQFVDPNAVYNYSITMCGT